MYHYNSKCVSHTKTLPSQATGIFGDPCISWREDPVLSRWIREKRSTVQIYSRSQLMADMAASLLQKSRSAVRLRKGLSQLCICSDSFKHWFVRWLKCFLWLTFVVLSKQLVRLPVWFGSPGVVMWKLLQYVGSGNTKQTQDLVIMCAACSVGLVS